MKMSTPELMAFIKASPKCTNADIAKRFNITASDAAVRTGLLFKQGRLTREIVGKNLSNVGIYGYTFKQNETVKEREKTQSNVRVAPVAISARPAPKTVKTTGQDVQMSELPKLSINQSLNSLADAMADAILSQVKARLAVEIGTLLPEVPSSHMPTPAELIERVSKPAQIEAPKMERALVVGLIPVQCGVISSEFHDAYELEFWNDRNGDGMEKLQTYARSADVVFIHTQHVSHKAVDAVKANCRGAIVYVNGGLTAMKDALTARYCGETK